MNRLIFALAITIILSLAISCKKDDPKAPDTLSDIYFTNLNDTTVAAWLQMSSDMSSYNLSLDKDSIVDLLIEVKTNWSPSSGSTYTIQLIPQNEYEMAFDSITYSRWSFSPNNPNSPDTVYGFYTVPIPLAMHPPEIISNQLKFSNQPRYLSYYMSFGVSASGTSSPHYYRVAAADYVYLAFRKETTTQPVWAWLKLKYAVIDGKFGVVLNSCKYNDSSDSFEID